MTPTSIRLSGVCLGLGLGSLLESFWGPNAVAALTLPLVVYTVGRIIGEAVKKARAKGPPTHG